LTKDYPSILAAIKADPRYRANLMWGEPRPGHPEGSIAAHIECLEENLERLRPKLTDEEAAKLRLLIHVHDTFKPQALTGVRCSHPQSHASLARAFLAEFCDDQELLDIVQNHDVPFALWRQVRDNDGDYDRDRLVKLGRDIDDWDLFIAFLLIDGCTPGKLREPLRWLIDRARERRPIRFDASDLD
jgi:hypothetical protein